MPRTPPFFILFFFNDTATTEIYTLSLHDALPISTTTQSKQTEYSTRTGLQGRRACPEPQRKPPGADASAPRGVSVTVAAVPHAYVGSDDASGQQAAARPAGKDRKSTRLNSSHLVISYA